MGHRGLIAYVLAAGFTLAGCATVVPAPHPAFDATTAASFERQWMDSSWRRSGLPDSIRPADPEIRLITNDTRGEEIVACMTDAGFDNYAENLDGYSRFAPQAAGVDEELALYLCEASRQISPVEAGVLNHSQLDYWYEYYRLELVPCLRGAGLELKESPSYEEFASNGGFWNPYLALDPNVRIYAIAHGDMLAKCPPNAPGLHRPWGFD